MGGTERHPEAASLSAEERERAKVAAMKTVSHLFRRAGKYMPIELAKDGDFPLVPGMYLFNSEVVDRGSVTSMGFEPRWDWMSGAANSAHVVIPGNARLLHSSGEVSSIPVAAKCYHKRTLDDRHQRAVREVTNMREMLEAGEFSFDPIGAALLPRNGGSDESDGAIVLLTRFDRPVYTMDNLPWGRSLTTENVSNAVLAANALGRFNARGRRHNDGGIKNVVALGGGATMIDFETVEPYDLGDPMAVALTVHTDLDKLFDTLGKFGMFTEHHDSYTRRPGLLEPVDAVRAICEDGYLTAWADAPLKTQDVVLDTMFNVASVSLGGYVNGPLEV